MVHKIQQFGLTGYTQNQNGYFMLYASALCSRPRRPRVEKRDLARVEGDTLPAILLVSVSRRLPVGIHCVRVNDQIQSFGGKII